MDLLDKATKRDAHPYLFYENVQNTPVLMQQCLEGNCLQSIQELASIFHKKQFKKVFFSGCGTSLFAGKVIGFGFDQILKTPTSAEDPFETQIYPPSDLGKDTALIIITHSGNTLVDRQVAEMAKKLGVFIAAFTDNPEAAILSQVDHAVVGPGGRDIAIPKTRSYTTALLRGMMLVAEIANLGGDHSLWKEIETLPQNAEKTIRENEDLVKEFTQKWTKADRVYGVGVGPNAWTGLEFGLKMMETNGMPSFGFELEEYCHGVELSLTDQSAALFFQSGDIGLDRCIAAVKATAATGSKTAVISSNSEVKWPESTHAMLIPASHDLLSPILMILPAQLMVYYTALALGKNPDVAGTDNPKIKEAISILHPPGTH
jgi:glucosamine--fructose-6-phosphate aminotransferase (isomerizing)